MRDITFTLVTDGSSDVVLLPILTWLLRTNGVALPLQGRWADTRRARLPQRVTLTERIRVRRVAEIQEALDCLPPNSPQPTAVCVIPVRMQEAWLLFDDLAINTPAGNRSFRENLVLPTIHNLETLTEPQFNLYE